MSARTRLEYEYITPETAKYKLGLLHRYGLVPSSYLRNGKCHKFTSVISMTTIDIQSTKLPKILSRFVKTALNRHKYAQTKKEFQVFSASSHQQIQPSALQTQTESDDSTRQAQQDTFLSLQLYSFLGSLDWRIPDYNSQKISDK